MAQTVEFNCPSGLGSLTVELFAVTVDTILSTTTATEQTNRNGVYRTSITTVLNGWHTAVIFQGVAAVAIYDVLLADADGLVHRCTEYTSSSGGGLTQQQTRDAMELAPTSFAAQVYGALPRLNATLNIPETAKTTYLPAITAGDVGGIALVGSAMGAVASVTAGVTLAASQHVVVDSGTVGTVTNPVTLAASQHVIVDSGTVTTLTNPPTGMSTLTASQVVDAFAAQSYVYYVFASV